MAKKTDERKKATPVKKDKKQSVYQAVGRRKEATARVKLVVVGEKEASFKDKKVRKGEIIVNYLPAKKYFPGQINKKHYMEPFRTTNTIGRFAVSALVSGGGLSGQLGAFIHGVSRAIEKIDKEKYRPILKKRGFLKRDARVKERRKAGLAQSARSKKQSPKR